VFAPHYLYQSHDVGGCEEVHPKHIRRPEKREAKVEGKNGGRVKEREKIMKNESHEEGRQCGLRR
jgi:hypothetical protein